MEGNKAPQWYYLGLYVKWSDSLKCLLGLSIYLFKYVFVTYSVLDTLELDTLDIIAYKAS